MTQDTGGTGTPGAGAALGELQTVVSLVGGLADATGSLATAVQRVPEASDYLGTVVDGLAQFAQVAEAHLDTTETHLDAVGRLLDRRGEQLRSRREAAADLHDAIRIVGGSHPAAADVAGDLEMLDYHLASDLAPVTAAQAALADVRREVTEIRSGRSAVTGPDLIQLQQRAQALGELAESLPGRVASLPELVENDGLRRAHEVLTSRGQSPGDRSAEAGAVVERHLDAAAGALGAADATVTSLARETQSAVVPAHDATGPIAEILQRATGASFRIEDLGRQLRTLREWAEADDDHSRRAAWTVAEVETLLPGLLMLDAELEAGLAPRLQERARTLGETVEGGTPAVETVELLTGAVAGLHAAYDDTRRLRPPLEEADDVLRQVAPGVSAAVGEWNARVPSFLQSIERIRTLVRPGTTPAGPGAVATPPSTTVPPHTGTGRDDGVVLD